MLVFQKQKETLNIGLHGEIDHASATNLRDEIDLLIEMHDISKLNFDFSKVSFMDSSGIGLILGRYKTMMAKGGSVSVTGLHPPIDRVFRLAGLHAIIAQLPCVEEDNG